LGFESSTLVATPLWVTTNTEKHLWHPKRDQSHQGYFHNQRSKMKAWRVYVYEEPHAITLAIFTVNDSVFVIRYIDHDPLTAKPPTKDVLQQIRLHFMLGGQSVLRLPVPTES
jgi:hypothetical protein